MEAVQPAVITPTEYRIDEERAFLGYDRRHRKYYGRPAMRIRCILPVDAPIPALGDRVTLDLGADGRIDDALVTGYGCREDPPAIELHALAQGRE